MSQLLRIASFSTSECMETMLKMSITTNTLPTQDNIKHTEAPGNTLPHPPSLVAPDLLLHNFLVPKAPRQSPQTPTPITRFAHFRPLAPRTRLTVSITLVSLDMRIALAVEPIIHVLTLSLLSQTLRQFPMDFDPPQPRSLVPLLRAQSAAPQFPGLAFCAHPGSIRPIPTQPQPPQRPPLPLDAAKILPSHARRRWPQNFFLRPPARCPPTAKPHFIILLPQPSLTFPPSPLDPTPHSIPPRPPTPEPPAQWMLPMSEKAAAQHSPASRLPV
nr:formin-like protein 14 [Penaeus vannamei]